MGSFGVAVALLVLLLVLTFVGTFAQGRMSLYDVQRRYFDALIAVVDVGPISIPLPGALLTLALLAVNLVVGGVVRLRRSRSTVGILVAHLGVLLLLAGGLVEALASDKGQMTLHEAGGDVAGAASRSSTFESWTEWDLVVAERRDGRRVEHVIPGERAESLDGGVLRATSPSLPFDVLVSSWVRNARPRRGVSSADGIHGWVIEALDPEREAERNVPMAAVTLAVRGGTAGPHGLVWGLEPFPWAVRVGDRTFEVALRHRSWALPFALRLDRFVHETHPGTRMDSRFSSYVTKIEGGVEREIHITMNQPLRHRGYTFYQSGWGPADAPPGTPLFSTFSVVRNPADRAPILACLVIATGLLMHFGRKILLHARAQAVRRTSDAAGAAPAGARRFPATPVLAGVLALVLASATAASAAVTPRSGDSRWTSRALERAAALPLQEGGRVKPLDSHAAFTLLRLNHRRGVTDAAGRSLTPLEWMLDVLFRPEAARTYPSFLVEDSQVLDAVGMSHEDKSRRDRYAFDDLAPARPRLAELARTYMAVESKDRSAVENGVVELYGNLETFDSLTHFLDFARVEIPLPAAPRVRELWPGRDRVSVPEVVARLDALTATAGGGDPHAGVSGAPRVVARVGRRRAGRGTTPLGGGRRARGGDRARDRPPVGRARGGARVAHPGRGPRPRGARGGARGGGGRPRPSLDRARRGASGDPAAFEREIVSLSEDSEALASTRGECDTRRTRGLPQPARSLLPRALPLRRGVRRAGAHPGSWNIEAVRWAAWALLAARRAPRRPESSSAASCAGTRRSARSTTRRS